MRVNDSLDSNTHSAHRIPLQWPCLQFARHVKATASSSCDMLERIALNDSIVFPFGLCCCVYEIKFTPVLISSQGYFVNNIKIIYLHLYIYIALVYGIIFHTN